MRRRKLYGILGALPTLTPACTSPLTADHQNIFKRFMSENQVLQTCKQSIQSTFKACLRQHAVNLSFALVVLMQHTVRGPDRLLRIHNKLYKKRATGKCGENVKKKTNTWSFTRAVYPHQNSFISHTALCLMSMQRQHVMVRVRVPVVERQVVSGLKESETMCLYNWRE